MSYLIYQFSLKLVSKPSWGGGGESFFRGDFSWVVGGTLPQNSFKPSQDLWKDTCKEEPYRLVG